LAAGEGTRLHPFSTKEYPKVLFPFRGKPLFCYHIEEFLKAGVCDFIVVCNPKNKEAINRIIRKRYSDLKISLVVQEKQLGPAHSAYAAKDQLRGTDFFVLKYADSWTKASSLKMILSQFSKDPQDGIVFLTKVRDFKRFGIARFEGETLVKIVEKPAKNPPSDLAWRGISVLGVQKFLAGFSKDKVWPGKKEVPPPEYVLRAGGRLNYRIVKYSKLDLGYLWDILLLNRAVLNKFGGQNLGRRIGAGASISPKSFIGPRTVIGPRVRIGDYVSLERAWVGKDAVIEDSYLMPGARIGSGAKIKKTVVGRKTEIGPGFITKDKDQTKGKNKVFVKGEYREAPFSALGCFLGHKVKVGPKLFSDSGKVVYSGREVNKNIVHDILPIRAVFFDADNTIYNTQKVAKFADKQAMAYLASGTPHRPENLYDYWRDKIVAKLKQSRNPKLRHRRYSYQRLIKEFKLGKSAQRTFLAFRSELVKHLEPAAHLKGVLGKLGDYQRVIVSEDNRDLIDFKLKALGLWEYFDLVIAAPDVGAMKPSSKYFQYALAKLKLHPGEVVMIGDDWEKDLAQAFDLGLRTIIWGKEDIRAHRVLKDFRKLPGLLGII